MSHDLVPTSSPDHVHPAEMGRVRQEVAASKLPGRAREEEKQSRSFISEGWRVMRHGPVTHDSRLEPNNYIKIPRKYQAIRNAMATIMDANELQYYFVRLLTVR